MALQLSVDSLESIPEALRGEYTEKDGKFHLNVEGLDDTSGLKSALQKERDARKALEKDVTRWKSLGKSADEIAELVAAKEKEAEEAARKAGNFDAILKQHQDRWAKEKGDLESELNASRASERKAIIDERLVSSLTKAGVTEEGLTLLPSQLSGRIKFETVDGKRVLKIMQADGETPMAGSGADGTAMIDDLVKEAVTKFPSLVKGSGAGGGGKPPHIDSGGSGVTKKSDLKTEKAKGEYVDKYGLDAYKALPG